MKAEEEVRCSMSIYSLTSINMCTQHVHFSSKQNNLSDSLFRC